jgi:uroporphyrinogen decarboxylase
LPPRPLNYLTKGSAGQNALKMYCTIYSWENKMTKREIIRLVLDGKKPPYVPWSIGLTYEAKQKLQEHFGGNLENALQNHILDLGSHIGFFEKIDQGHFRDIFGVVWDRTKDKDIGIPANLVLREPSLKGCQFPDPLDERFFENIPAMIAQYPDRFRVFQIGFSLYERAWTLRGMENLMMDFVEHPEFVVELFGAIAKYNIAQIQKAMEYDIDAVYFGDDWGQQQGLQMGPQIWRQFIKPVIKSMYAVARNAGKYVMIHSCGDVDEVFDDLIEIGLNCFNPFQPEVMDVFGLLEKYRGKLSFHGGLSTQRTLPFGLVTHVRTETLKLLEVGSKGGYIFAPAHAVEGDVSVENMLAFIDILQVQENFQKSGDFRASSAINKSRPLP